MKPKRSRRLSPIILTLTTVLTLPLTLPAQAADPANPPKGAAQYQAPATKDVDNPAAVPDRDRTALLGRGYGSSTDTAFTTTGDGTGFHLLVADESDGYGWKTAASLSEPGFEADTWIGNACLTESGKRAAVAYAPRTFTNKPGLMARGAFSAIVDLESGEVTKLPFQASLAYFSPGCGSGEQAVFTQLSYEEDAKQQTRLISVDAESGEAAKPLTYPGQVTSAVPTKDGVVAAHGNRVVRAGSKSKLTEITRTRTVPFQLTVDAADGLTYIDRTENNSSRKASTSYAQHLKAGQLKERDAVANTVASGELTAWDLASSADGTIYVTGKAKNNGTLPKTVKNPGGIAKDARISSHGHAAFTTTWADGKDTRIRPEEALTERTARTTLRLLATKKTVTLDARPGEDRIGGQKSAKQGRTVSPGLPKPQSKTDSDGSGGDGVSTQTMRTQLVNSSPSDPSEDASERTCSVARNDVKKQAFQPTPRQVEWAVDQAVVGKLNLYRPANWKNTGMAGYSPQSLFPAVLLEGDPNGHLDSEDDDNDRWHIPSQILLGVTAQESNMWQATRYAVPGVTANSLIGNYYGVDYAPDGQQGDPWAIHWDDADCGYGITQVTDGMRLPDHNQSTKTVVQQEAVALDYTANIAAGAQILSEKWNQTRKAGMKVNDGHPKWIENWFFALWAYNSGFYPQSGADSAGHWGVGWTNNPANPLWKANRLPFLENARGDDNYADAAHPQYWPYQEKVIGWAARPISAMFAPGDMQAGYRPAWWNDKAYRTQAKPPIDLFCDDSNSCDPGKISDGDSNDPGQGACTLDAGDSKTNPHWLHCWWNKSVEWKSCDELAQCGYQVHRFNTSYPEQSDANSYPPQCSSKLPDNALIVDDVSNGTTPAGSVSRGCGPIQSDGSFTLNYSMWNGTYPGKMDTHQIGAGYGNHFWFAHTRQPESTTGTANRMEVTGVWKLNTTIPGRGGDAEVFVHIPDHGAQTAEAVYEIVTAFGTKKKKISQSANQSNKWVSLGGYRFKDKRPEVRLSNFNSGGTGDKDIAWDAIAFVPGDQSKLPEVIYGDPNLSVDQPDDDTTPTDVSLSVINGAGPAGPSATSATSVAAIRAAATGSFVDWCDNKPFNNHVQWINRSQACLKEHIPVVISDKEGKIVGTMDFDVQAEIKSYTEESGMNTKLKLVPTSATGLAATAPVTITFAETCQFDCTTSNAIWKTSSTWTWATGDRHVGDVQVGLQWGATRASELVGVSWKLGAVVAGNPSKNVVAVSTDRYSQLRCDRTVTANPGCVFEYYKPTYVMNAKRFPAAAAHAWLVQTRNDKHFGRKDGGTALTYMNRDDWTSTDSRKVICPQSPDYIRRTDIGLSPELSSSNKDRSSCDEFAFANSYQSAGMPGNLNGTNPVADPKECLATYAAKVSSGHWTLLSDDNYDLPVGGEVCGRSSMSNNQNSQSMSYFGGFINRNRLKDGDDYWVGLPGFDGCAMTAEICDVR
ncbi:golvesin C-terminal-like domain-containing protein [Streptomyces tendae]|uniref:golvesin C-terminal-like domain-containing protein n=1 Tax=Streptomyces tendae TaxID=1932 RepID=UPI003716B64C